ncbi:MAG: DUF4214 domain-containing protein [Clostridia bacterium]|nr:DUF4214 domain-containing protein [Clostridia bacterium]
MSELERNYKNEFNIDLIEPSELSQEDYLKLTYITLLQRKIDKVGFEFWNQKIKDGHYNHKELIDNLSSSPEFIMHYRIPFSTVLHKGRQQWVSSLERFENIFDIGGSSPNIAEGALIEMGYPYRPKELIIFDLPEEKQYWGKPKYPQDRDYSYTWGFVKFEHGFIEDINEYNSLSEKTFDLIFMGQVIEHIQRNKIDIVLNWIKKHLKSGGKFIFDTPNRNITKIQSSNEFIDRDHKYEYTPEELEEILVKCGFRVTQKTGILNMPNTFLSKQFNPLEVYESEIINNTPETSYVFAFECIPI